MSQIIQDKIDALQTSYVGGVFIKPVKSVLTDLNPFYENGLTRLADTVELGGILNNQSTSFESSDTDLYLEIVNKVDQKAIFDFMTNNGSFAFRDIYTALNYTYLGGNAKIGGSNNSSNYNFEVSYSGLDKKSIYYLNTTSNSIVSGANYIDLSSEARSNNDVLSQFLKVRSVLGVNSLVMDFPIASNVQGNRIIPLSVNGNFADIAGNITIAAGGAIPSLQQVTEIGNTTSYDIVAKDFKVSPDGIDIPAMLTVVSDGGTNYGGNLRLQGRFTSFYQNLQVNPNLSSDRTIYLPSAISSKVLAVSVNGNYADEAGNITIDPTVSRFGIEDNVGIQNRIMSMQGNKFSILGSSTLYLGTNDNIGGNINQSPGGVSLAYNAATSNLPSSSLTVQANATTYESLAVTTNGITRSGIQMSPYYLVFTGFQDGQQLKSIEVPKIIGSGSNLYMPVSVNGNLADYTGNITIPTGTTAPLNYIVVTKAQLDALITSSTLVKGATYKVLDVHTSLYNDGTTSGTSIYVRAIEDNKIATTGIGKFFNPKYNPAVNNLGIWNTISYAVGTAPVTGVFRPGETITGSNGATATLVSGFSFNKIYFTVLTGDWSTSTTATNASGVVTNISSVFVRTYAAASKVIWGGYTWTNNAGNVGASTSIFALNTEWTKVAYNTTDYNEVYDNIDYDYVNNIIVKRSDLLANVIEYEFADLAYLASKSVVGTPISCFQWGNKFSQRNKVHTGCIENINLMGEMMGNDVSGQSIITNTFMFTDLVIVEQSNNLVYHNILRGKSEMRNNVIIEGSGMYRITLASSSSVNGNKIYNSAYIADSFLDTSCQLSNNEIRRAVWIGNQLRQTCAINGNLSNQNACHILSNKLYRNATINSNILNGVYVQLSGSDRSFIFNNDLNTSTINSNTINIVPNGRTIYIGSNNLIGDSSNDIPIRVSAINGCTITGNGNTYIRMCELKCGQILNAVINTPSNDFRFLDVEDYVWNFNSVISTGRLDGVKVNSKSITASFLKGFDGGVGSGAIGNVIIPVLEAPAGYFIEEVIIDVQVSLVGTGAIINLGIAVDNTQSGINNTTGDVATLNTAGITKIIQSTFTKAIATRAIVMEVKTAAITSGTIGIRLKISKL